MVSCKTSPNGETSYETETPPTTLKKRKQSRGPPGSSGSCSPMTPLTTLRTAQLFQMSCPLISSTDGIRIGSTAAAWLADWPPAPAPAADGSGEAISRYLTPFPHLLSVSELTAAAPHRSERAYGSAS